MRVNGVGGELRAGGRWAARLGTWSGELTPDGGTVRARVAQADPWWIERGPFVLDLRLGESVWRWRGAEAYVEGEAVQITMQGDREVVRYAT